MAVLMRKIKPYIVFLICSFLCISYCFCAENDESDENKDSRSSSFYSRTLSGKYNLLEDDFQDVPHRPGKYDYLKEEMEAMRFFSRPDAEEFAIVNMQWKGGAVFVNDFETVLGKAKQRRGLFKRQNRFFYRLLGKTGSLVHEASFEVPSLFHYDFFDDETGDLSGGALEREEFNFVIKIPLADKTAERILFLQRKTPAPGTFRTIVTEESDAADNNVTVIGETLF
ncbi:MAG: hypothetical protein GY868_11740 [Deltaproteobacteria bacterium]|nr:hypothetical protein [Deltaproteobacteria bacterium]